MNWRNPFNFNQTGWEIFSDMMAVGLIVSVIAAGLSFTDPEGVSYLCITLAVIYLILKAYSYGEARKLREHSFENEEE